MRRVGYAIVIASALALVSPVPGGTAVLNFGVSIDGAQETPPNASPGTGSGTFTLDTTTGVAAFNITFGGLLGTEIAAHVHVAPPSVPGAILYALPPGSPKVGNSPVLTPTQQADMIAGLHYVNIHTSPTFI